MGTSPIQLDIVSAITGMPSTVTTFNSYNFDKSVLTPAAAFRFTAPGVEKEIRRSIRSGDQVVLSALDNKNKPRAISTGLIDDTDTHITQETIEYVLTGRDMVGQLVDNSSVDSKNNIINIENATIDSIVKALIGNTRIPQYYSKQQTPNGTFLFNTNAGETKINSLQRYLELANCLVWGNNDGSLLVGKPNFAQSPLGSLVIKVGGNQNNLAEARVRRNLNQIIRQIVVKLQTQDQVKAGNYTQYNNILLGELNFWLKLNGRNPISTIEQSNIGRSVYEHFTYGQGADAANLLTGTGTQKAASPENIGAQMGLRQIARDSMRILDVECVITNTHINENNIPYNIDQIYSVQIDDEDVNEDMYVYGCSYEETLEHGMMTRLRLCRLGTICAGSYAFTGVSS